jgi:myxalamid-type polyketide synthase MxaB
LIIGSTHACFSAYQARLQEAKINLSYADNVASAVKQLLNDDSIDGLCYCWGPNLETSGPESIDNDWRQHYAQLLKLVKDLDTSPLTKRPLRLWLVTYGGQWLDGDSADDIGEASLASSTLWGFGRVLLNELPRLRTTLVDLALDEADSVSALIDEWLAWDSAANEHQVAYRNGKRHVRRILAEDPHGFGDNNFELKITEYGLFEHIKPVPIADSLPIGDQIRIEIRSVGLNFKDVLNALGLLKRHAEEAGIAYEELPLGFEAAGVVVARGEQAEFDVGDEVMLSNLGCMKRYLTIPSIAAVKKPHAISFDQAASLPTAYITAYYSLNRLAQIKRGDRVLIHAAAGGVGQAAVQLAQAAGAEVFATASPGKWDHLHAQGITHISNSRTLEFASEINDATHDCGVDIILNSLSGDFIEANLSCIAEGGRFIEIGKLGAWSQEQIQQARPDIDYHNFDLSELPEEELNRLNHDILERIGTLITEGTISDLPTTPYTLDEIDEAFSVLSRGANIGKLTLRITNNTDQLPHFQVQADKTYLITGGYGALGKVVSKQLADLGARHIALVSRSKPTQDTLSEIDNALGNNVNVTHLQADIGDKESVTRLFDELRQTPFPLVGIFHAAGVLADLPLAKQDITAFEQVFAAKVRGTYLLHQASLTLPNVPGLYGFSSVAAVLGSAGQGNYAAANAFIDQLAIRRQALGLPAKSINWGPWREVGMAAEMTEQQRKSLEGRGIHFLSPRRAMHTMMRIMARPETQHMIGEFDWNRYVENQTAPDLLYEKVTGRGEFEDARIRIEELKAMPVAERNLMLRELLRDKIAMVLHLDNAEQVGIDARFSELGLDSLVAVELKNTLEAMFEIQLPSSLIFDYPSLPTLSAFLSEQLGSRTEAEVADEKQQRCVAEMSDDEVEDELMSLGGSL